MTELETFVKELKQKYQEDIIVKPASDKINLAQIPAPLQEFYTYYDFLELPFGQIDSVEKAIQNSNTAEPFKSEKWFCFGFDGYFSYWLCSYEADSDGLWITSWDHEMDDEMEGVYTTLLEFLQDLEEEYEENH